MYAELTTNSRLVTIESPFAHVDERVAALYREYLAAAAYDCFVRGEVPFASHGLYVHWLDDNDAEERRLGIQAGLIFAQKTDASVVYQDLGVSPGMRQGIQAAETTGRTVEYRNLGDKWRQTGDYLQGYAAGMTGSSLPFRANAYYQYGWGDARSKKPRDWSMVWESK